MKTVKCPDCNGRGGGGNSTYGTAYVRSRCHGKGQVRAFKIVRREFRYPVDWSARWPNVPCVYDDVSGVVVGDVTHIFDDGINVEHNDGKPWSFYKWSEVPNADEIKAAWEKLKNEK